MVAAVDEDDTTTDGCIETGRGELESLTLTFIYSVTDVGTERRGIRDALLSFRRPLSKQPVSLNLAWTVLASNARSPPSCDPTTLAPPSLRTFMLARSYIQT